MKLIHKKCGSTLRTMVYYAYEDGSTRNKHCKDWTWCEKCARPVDATSEETELAK